MQITYVVHKLIGSKLINDSFWSLVGNMLSKGLGFAAGIIIARFLGKDIYGEYSIVKSTLILIGSFATFGLGYTATKFIAEYRNNKPDYVITVNKYVTGITLIFSSFLMLVLFFSAGIVANKILVAPELKIPLRLLSVLVVLNALTTTQIGILAGLGRFKELAVINSVVGIVIFLTSLILTYYYKLNGALGALLITQILNCVFNYKLINKTIPPNTENSVITKDSRLIKEIIYFSTPVALQETFYWVIGWFSGFLLIRIASFGELGLFTAAIQWNAIILFIPSILRNVILTNLSEVNSNEVQHSLIIKRMLAINFSVTFILSIIIFIFSPYINKLYGVSFEGLDNLVRVAIFITIFGSMSDIYAQAYMSKGMTWLMFYLRFLRDSGIILIFLLLVKIDIFRAAKSLIFSNLTMQIVFLFIMMIVYRKKVEKKSV